MDSVLRVAGAVVLALSIPPEGGSVATSITWRRRIGRALRNAVRSTDPPISAGGALGSATASRSRCAMRAARAA